jgi:hypothetical protein
MLDAALQCTIVALADDDVYVHRLWPTAFNQDGVFETGDGLRFDPVWPKNWNGGPAGTRPRAFAG